MYYNRGVFNAALVIEGVRLAVEKFGLPVTGEKVKLAYEQIKTSPWGLFAPTQRDSE